MEAKPFIVLKKQMSAWAFYFLINTMFANVIGLGEVAEHKS
jgi:hypothetical protein